MTVDRSYVVLGFISRQARAAGSAIHPRQLWFVKDCCGVVCAAFYVVFDLLCRVCCAFCDAVSLATNVSQPH